jgi:hypothetical protein
MTTMATLATWQLTAHLHAPGAPPAAGSLIRCEHCDGRGWLICEPPAGHLHPYEHAATDRCWRCLGTGTFALPVTRGHLDVLIDAGELPAALAAVYEAPAPSMPARGSRPDLMAVAS